MKKISIFSGTILLITFGLLNSNAIANPMHATVFIAMDAPQFSTPENPTNGNQIHAIVDNSTGQVQNAIVCSVWCGSNGGNGFFGTTVPMAPENAGAIWFGPNTTTYDRETRTFTAIDPVAREITNTSGDSSATVFGNRVLTFVSGNIFVVNEKLIGVTESWSLDSVATVSVTENNASESLFLGNRKTNNEIEQLVNNSNLLLLNDRVQILINLLDSWVK
jgi:hypothetical protein